MSEFRGVLLKFLIISNFVSQVLTLAPWALQLTYPDDVMKLARLQRVKDVLNHYGYPGEDYTVQTADGYRLTISRIPNPGGKAVLLMHGLRGWAMNWVMMGPWSDLSYLLHDQGYDVWLGNTRGTRVGQRHVKFSPNEARFWNYSLTEIGLYDVSATIDFVLEKSGQQKLSYIGHSQGCAVFYILTSLRPEYNKNIMVMHALAPAVYMHNLRSPLKIAAKYYLESMQYPYYAKVNDINYSGVCLLSTFARDLCLRMLNRVGGPSQPGSLNLTMAPVLLANYPETCSVRQIAHFYQIHRKARFTPFDYDFVKGKIINSAPYPLEKVDSPSAIYYCRDDYIVDARDVKRLIKELPNVIEERFVEECNHMDVLLSTRARAQFFYKILEVEERVRSGNKRRV